MELVQLSSKYDEHAKTCFKEDILVQTMHYVNLAKSSWTSYKIRRNQSHDI